MIKKINSEYKINEENSPFVITMGTSNKKNPEIIYSILSAYITPNDMDFDENIFDEMSKNIKKTIKTILFNSDICERDIIVVTDVATNRMTYNKQSYFDMQIYFKPKRSALLNSDKKFKNISDKIYVTYVKNIISIIEKHLQKGKFNMSKTKNKAQEIAIY